MLSSELDYISVKGFKSFAALEKLPLRAINVVIGPNGSGKSNFIGVFSFLRAIHEGKLQEYVARSGGAEKVLHFGSKTTRQIEIQVSFKECVGQHLQLVPAAFGGEFEARRFVPFVVMHEFEGLLFSDCDRFANGISRPQLAQAFRGIRRQFASPEEIKRFASDRALKAS
jgi:hypothetical protein